MANTFIIKRTLSYQDIKQPKITIRKSLSYDSNIDKYNDESRLNFRKYIVILYLIFIKYNILYY